MDPTTRSLEISDSDFNATLQPRAISGLTSRRFASHAQDTDARLTFQFARRNSPRPSQPQMSIVAGGEGDVAAHHYPTQRRRSSMAVARINSEFRRIDLAQERETRVIPVCRATKDEWRAYLGSENQALKSKCCEWIEGTIYIVEPLSPEHEHFTQEVKRALRAPRGFDAYVKAHGSANIPDLPDLNDYEPDDSYGPRDFMGAPFPPGVQDYRSWYTLIVEVGKSRGWGDGAGMLDWKAEEWAQFPGVRYILCVAVTDHLATAEYKLYTVERNNNGEALPLPVLNPVPVVGPQTLVAFDSRELLGLPPGANIPRSPYSRARFPDPTFTLDLFEVLEMARRT